MGQPALRPFHVHRIAAARAKPAYRARFPRGRQCGKKAQFSAVALEQHLGNTRGGAKVAVYLERRVGVQQIGVTGAGQQGAKIAFRLRAVAQPGEKADDPCTAPAGMPAAVGQAEVQRALGGGV